MLTVLKLNKDTETESKDKTIHTLTAQAEALTQTIDSLKQLRTQTQAPEQPCSPVYKYSSDKARSQRKQRPYGCPQCVEQGLPSCSHCFACGEEGHHAVGCLRKSKQPVNGLRSRQRDNPLPHPRPSPQTVMFMCPSLPT